MTTTNSSKTYVIIYGWAEGEYHSRHFRHALEQAGYHRVTDVTVADIIVAHSAGCSFVPLNASSTYIFLINPSYWPGKLAVVSGVQKIWRDGAHFARQKNVRQWIPKMARHIWYGATNPKGLLTAFRAQRSNPLNRIAPKNHIVLIRNTNDPWCTPRFRSLMKPLGAFFELSGEHDECWTNPEPHVRIIADTTSPTT